jgi:hypothetical protein
MYAIDQWVHAHPWVAIAIVGLVAANLAILLMAAVVSGREATDNRADARISEAEYAARVAYWRQRLVEEQTRDAGWRAAR